MWHSVSMFQTWLLFVLPAEQLWGCLLPVPAGSSSLPDWSPLITCQLDRLQVFIICDDWDNLEANLNQACRERAASITPVADLHKTAPQEVHFTSEGSDFVLHVKGLSLSSDKHQHSAKSFPEQIRLLIKSSLAKNVFVCLTFGGELLPHLCLLQLPFPGFYWLPLWLVTQCFCKWHG